jgi:hypothetical protein
VTEDQTHLSIGAALLDRISLSLSPWAHGPSTLAWSACLQMAVSCRSLADMYSMPSSDEGRRRWATLLPRLCRASCFGLSDGTVGHTIVVEPRNIGPCDNEKVPRGVKTLASFSPLQCQCEGVERIGSVSVLDIVARRG